MKLSQKNRLGLYTFLTIFVLENAFVSLNAQASPTGVPDFTLVLVAPSASFKLGEPIHLKVRLTNTTDHIVYVGVPPGPGWGDEIVGIDLTDSTGQPVPKWRDLNTQASAGKPMLHGRSIRSDNVPAGGMIERDVRLEKVFKVSAPGHYTVRVGRWDPNSHTSVKSEPVGIDIAPAS